MSGVIHGLGIWLYLTAAVAAPAARQDASDLATVALALRVDRDSRQLSGTATWLVPAPANPPTLLLYPNRFAKPPAELNDLTLRRLYPGEPDPGWMEVTSIAVDGRTAAIPAPGQRLTSWPVSIPAKPTGQPLRITVAFKTHIPRRFGTFGAPDDSWALDGGFYPVLQGQTGEPARHRVELQVVGLPPGANLIVQGRLLHASANPAQPVSHSFAALDQLSLRLLPKIRAERLRSGRTQVVYLHPPHFAAGPGECQADGTRPPELGTSDTPCSILATVARGLDVLQPLLPSDALPARLVLVEAALRHDLAAPVGGMVWISDRAFVVTPVERILKFHRFRVLRAVFAAVWRKVMQTREAPADLAWVADVLAEWSLRQYIEKFYGKAEDAFGVLAPGAFLAAIDDVLYAPQMDFMQAYFSVIDDTDPLRDTYDLFGHGRPTGRRIYEKLRDRMTPAALDAALADVAKSATTPMRRHPDLPGTTFFDEWLGPYPRFNLRLQEVTSRPTPTGYVHRVVIARSGDQTPVEPVSVRFVTKDGRVHDRVLPGTEATGEVTIDSPSRLERVTLDPNQRLVEHTADRGADARLDNRTDLRLKFLIERPFISFALTEDTIVASADFKFRRLYDLHHAFGLRPFHLALADGLSLIYDYGFGPKVTPNRLLAMLEFAVSASRLRSRGDAAGGWQTSASVWFNLESRLTPLTPVRGYHLLALASVILGPRDDGTTAAFQGLLSGTYLQPLTFNHILAFYAGTGMTFGSVRTQQLFGVGGRAAVRALPTTERVGRYLLNASMDYRHSWSRLLDLSVLRLSWVRELEGALLIDAATVASRCDDWFSGRSSAVAIGYGLRFHADLLGVNPSMLSIDLSYPLPITALGRPRPGRPPIGLQLYFTQNY